MDLHPDFRDLLAEFVRSEVRFVVVGGYAMAHHAKPRATKNLDLLVSGSSENLSKVAHALDRFGAPASVVQAAAQMGPTDIMYMGVEPVRVDLLRSADGIGTEEIISRARRSRWTISTSRSSRSRISSPTSARRTAHATSLT